MNSLGRRALLLALLLPALPGAAAPYIDGMSCPLSQFNGTFKGIAEASVEKVDADKKIAVLRLGRHRVVEAAHPSPLSAKKFRGSKPFSTVNAALAELGQAPLEWRLP